MLAGGLANKAEPASHVLTVRLAAAARALDRPLVACHRAR